MIHLNKLILATLLFGAPHTLQAKEFHDGFEDGLENWQVVSPDHALIVSEPGSDNHVLELTPRRRAFSHVTLAVESPTRHARMEGRFLFSTESDGYLGFIYNHVPGEIRTDFGVLYVKSNGSYIRVSPHYDGNPSWRLYEEMKVMLEGASKMEPNRWYRFRLDVHGRSAALYIEDMETPAVVFDEAPNSDGAFGLEARPGGGEPVWVDDVRIVKLQARANPEIQAAPESVLGGWQHLPAMEITQETSLDMKTSKTGKGIRPHFWI